MLYSCTAAFSLCLKVLKLKKPTKQNRKGGMEQGRDTEIESEVTFSQTT